MSISSHLTPEPERRLWIIHDNMRRAVEWTDTKLAVLVIFAAAELSFLKPGLLGLLGLVPLSSALLVGIIATLPLTRIPRWLAFLEPAKGEQCAADCLIAAEDLAKYTHLELILRLDKYLGGGITATRYYEDIVGQTVLLARIVVRKQRLFLVALAFACLGQLGLLAR